jgi:hypothetical protein
MPIVAPPPSVSALPPRAAALSTLSLPLWMKVKD